MAKRLPIPPGPRSLIPVAVFRQLRKDPLAFLTKLTAEYGDVSSFKAVGTRYVVINHPDIVREILLTQADAFLKGPALQNSKGILGEGLLTAEGEEHKRHRRLLQPSFHAKHVESYMPEVLGATRDLVNRWEGAEGQTLDVRPAMMGLTLTIAGKTLFGAAISAEESATVSRCVDDLMNNYVRAVVPWGKLLNMLPLKSTKKLAKARKDLQGVVDGIIRVRRAEIQAAGEAGAARGAAADLLTQMIAATDPEGSAKTKLTDTQLRDHCITILTAGHETTANALTFTLYLLAKHPEQQEKLRAEAAAILREREPGLADVDHLEFARNVLSESMRLLPPAWTLGRQNQREVELGGFRIPRKATILIPQWTLHRDGRFFSDPLAFEPDRWKNPRHPRFAYLPFSTGPRNCIGEAFAWLEMMLVLPMLVQRFRFSMAADAPPLKLTPAITLRPRNPVVLDILPV